MAEEPWRNPRPAPQLDEVRRQVPRRAYVSSFFGSWWPALLWAAVIFVLSTDSFSSDHTGRVIYAVFHWLMPSLTLKEFEPIHHLIRKSAHFTEYFIFCVLLFRGTRGTRAGWRWTWALAAVSVAAGYAALDEIHQAFVASRVASPWDALLDSVGAFAASLALLAWYRARPSAAARGAEAEPASD